MRGESSATLLDPQYLADLRKQLGLALRCLGLVFRGFDLAL
jgi:hypothetical protein